MKQKSRFDALFVSDGYFTSASRERALQSTSHYQSIQPRAAYSITGDGSKLKMKLQLPFPTSFVSRHKFKRQFSITAQNMSTATSQTDTSISNSLELQLSDEEQTIYQELSSLSAKIRRLDEIYYGGISDASDSFAITKVDSEKKSDASTTAIYGDVSDDEYDALARREAELCTMFPRLLTLLENESGLGKQATRFGGRVGQLYEEIDTAAEEIDASSKKAKTKVKPKAKAVSSTKKRIKRQHLSNAPMQSLDNAMNDLEAVAWLNRVRKLLLSAAMKDVSTSENNIGHSIDEDENATTNNATAITIPLQILAEPKIDGLSLSLRYQLRDTATPNNDGTEHEYVYDFVWGATRGDGTQGEDVSEAVQSAWMKSNTILEDEHSSIPRSFSIASDKSNPNIDPPATLEIRGEVVLPLKSFEEFTRNLTTDLIESSNTTDDNSTTTTKSIPTYTNARNAASGILLRSKEPTSQEDIERTRWLQSRLKFYAYDIVSSSSSLISKNENIELPGSWLYEMVGKSGKDMMNILNKLGFSIPNPVVVESVNISSERELEDTDVPTLLEYHRNLMTARDASIAINDNKKNKKKQFNFPYQIDGVVYKVSAMENRQTCGSSSRTPRWAIAHKFPPECAITQLINIEVQVGRTGALTPVAILKPVDLGGVMVSRASLHNFHFAKKILLAGDHSSDSMTNENTEETMEVKRGVSVLVSRAGDVIPQVMKRIFDDEVENEISSVENEWISLAPPVNCPDCGSPTSFDFVTSPARKKGGKKASKLLSENNGDDNVSVVDLMEGVDMNMDSDDQSSALVETSDDPENGQVLRCSGPQLLCQPRSVGAIVHAYSRTGLDVKGISESRLRQLIEENIIRFPADLFQVFGNKHGDSQSKEEGEISFLCSSFFALIWNHPNLSVGLRYNLFDQKCWKKSQTFPAGDHYRRRT